MPKYFLTFEKAEPVRWLGHLDILRTFERAIRRAALPIAFSNGFNPRERLAFGAALGTGITGGAERATLELTELLSPEQIQEDLNTTLPPGLRIQNCSVLSEESAKTVLSGCDRGEYTVVCSCPPETTLHAVSEAICTLLACETVLISREREGRAKEVNIRPNLYALSLVPDSLSGERLTLRMVVGQGESGTAKPAEVIAALSAHLPGIAARRSHRVRLIDRTEQIF